MHLFCECSITKSLCHSLQKTFNSLLTLLPLDPIISIIGRRDIDNPNNIVLLFKGKLSPFSLLIGQLTYWLILTYVLLINELINKRLKKF